MHVWYPGAAGVDYRLSADINVFVAQYIAGGRADHPVPIESKSGHLNVVGQDCPSLSCRPEKGQRQSLGVVDLSVVKQRVTGESMGGEFGK